MPWRLWSGLRPSSCGGLLFRFGAKKRAATPAAETSKVLCLSEEKTNVNTKLVVSSQKPWELKKKLEIPRSYQENPTNSANSYIIFDQQKQAKTPQSASLLSFSLLNHSSSVAGATNWLRPRLRSRRGSPLCAPQRCPQLSKWLRKRLVFEVPAFFLVLAVWVGLFGWTGGLFGKVSFEPGAFESLWSQWMPRNSSVSVLGCSGAVVPCNWLDAAVSLLRKWDVMFGNSY